MAFGDLAAEGEADAGAAGFGREEGDEEVRGVREARPLVADADLDEAADAREAADIDYGRNVARQVAGLDLGQTVVISDCACVAVEAMEGTDETIERAARIAGEKPITVVKVSKPKQDMRFDVPVVGLRTIEVMKRCRATALAIDARRTLLMDRAELLSAADAASIAIQAFEP